MTLAASAGIDAAARKPGRAGLNANLIYWLLIAPAAVLLAAFYLYPIATVLWISVTEPKPGLGNYELLVTSGGVQHVLLTTARICAATTAVALLLGYVVAYSLVHAAPRQKRWLFMGVLLPLWISVLARAFAWVTLLRREGLINQLLLAAGLIDQPLPLMWNELGITIGMVHYMLPYAILPLYANMRDIDARVIAAARGLGADRTQAFLRVFLPLSMPGVFGGCVLVFILSLGFYITPQLLGGPTDYLISMFIAIQVQELLNWGYAALLAIILLISTVGIFLIASRFVRLDSLFRGRS